MATDKLLDPKKADFGESVRSAWLRRFPDSCPDAIPIFSLANVVAGLLAEFHASVLKAHGHTHSSYMVLALLSLVPDNGGLSPVSLCDQLRQTSGGMNKTLKRLTEAGLVTRQPNATNKRTVDIVLTAKGIEEANKLCPIEAASQLRRLSWLSDKQKADIESALFLLVQSLSD